MSFTDHKITQFVHRVVDLPDQPNLPSDELKARFDSSPEELRVAHNALCDDADRLDDRVSGIIAETFGDTISKSMLSDELADEIDAKATQTALTAEISAREEIGVEVAKKCEIYLGSYDGNDAQTRSIELGFTPKAVLLFSSGGRSYSDGYFYGGLALQNKPVLARDNKPVLALTETGFTVRQEIYFDQAYVYIYANSSGQTYHYLAFG